MAKWFISSQLQDTAVLTFFFSQNWMKLLYFMISAAFVFIPVSGSFTWHLKFLKPLVLLLIHEDNRNLHPATTFLL